MSFTFDGVLGLGLPSLSQTPEFNFLRTGAAMGAWEVEPERAHMFAVFLATSDEEESEITFGGWQQERMLEGAEFSWNNVQDSEYGYWQLDILGMEVDGVPVDFCEEGCRAVVDTGTSLLGVPSLLGPELVRLMRHNMDSTTGLCNGYGPRLTIKLENSQIHLDPADYARPEVIPSMDSILAPVEGQAEAEDEKSCVPMLMHIDLPAPLSAKTIILGEPALQRYYTAFDSGALRVGFTEAIHALPKAPASIFA